MNLFLKKYSITFSQIGALQCSESKLIDLGSNNLKKKSVTFQPLQS